MTVISLIFQRMESYTQKVCASSKLTCSNLATNVMGLGAATLERQLDHKHEAFISEINALIKIAQRGVTVILWCEEKARSHSL